jgi:hypothetical protein
MFALFVTTISNQKMEKKLTTCQGRICTSYKKPQDLYAIIG